MPTRPRVKGNPSTTTWQKLYERAIFEHDNRKLFERISEARHAIYDRAEEILTDSSTSECSSLTSALRTLRLLEETAVKQSAA